MTQAQPCRRRREQVGCVEHLERGVARRIVGHLSDDADAHAEFDVGLDHVGVERGEDDIGLEFARREGRVDGRASGEAEVVGHDRILRQRLDGERLRLGQRMAPGHQHDAVPFVAGQGDEFGIVGQRLGRDADVDVALGCLLGDLQRIALVQHDLDLGVPRGELPQHLRQHVPGLRVRGGDGQRPGVLAAEFIGDALQVGELAQRAARRGDDDDAGGRQCCESLALPDEDRKAEFVLQLPDLLADAGLRGEQRLGRDRNVEAVIDDSAQVSDLL